MLDNERIHRTQPRQVIQIILTVLQKNQSPINYSQQKKSRLRCKKKAQLRIIFTAATIIRSLVKVMFLTKWTRFTGQWRPVHVAGNALKSQTNY